MKKRWVYNVVIYTKRDGRKLETAKRRTYIGVLLFIAKMSKKYSKEFAEVRIDGCFHYRTCIFTMIERQRE